nr:MAG TPA: hypothetical protein [Caudoviricetes sp.]
MPERAGRGEEGSPTWCVAQGAASERALCRLWHHPRLCQRRSDRGKRQRQRAPVQLERDGNIHCDPDLSDCLGAALPVQHRDA